MTDQVPSGAVVVGCDGSWQSLRSVATGTREAAARGAALVLLSLARPRPADRLAELREAEAAALAEATATVKHAADVARASRPGVRVESLVVSSWQDHRLEELAHTATLLVLGSHGRGGQAAFSIGSVSGDLVRLLRVPVLVAGEPGPPHLGDRERARARVKVGYRPGTDHPELLRVAACEAALRETGLEVVAATGSAAHGEVARLQHAVWRDIDALPDCAGIPLHVLVIDAPVVTALLLGTRPGDLVVVGTRGGGTLAGLVEGSTARVVLDASPSDVMVVPPSVCGAGELVAGSRARPLATG